MPWCCELGAYSLLQQLSSFANYRKFIGVKSSCEILVNKEIVPEDYTLSFTEEVVTYLSNKMEKLSPVTKIYLTAYRLLSEEHSEQYFQDLTDLLILHDQEITNKEKNNLYLFAINYCVLQMKRNNKIN